MKTMKYFFMAALAILMTACSSDDNELTQLPVKAEGITITAQLAPKSSNAKTRAVTESGNKIVVDWAVNEHLAILYDKDGNQMADATITAVDDDGAATITFTVVEGTADDTECQIIYPYSAAKEDKTGVKDNSTLLGAQDGTLNANLDVRVGAGKIQTSTPSLTVTTQPAAQFAIWKLTLPQASKDMYVISEAGEFLAGAILSDPGTDFTVAVPAAVPAVSSKVTIVATDGTSGCWSYSNTATLEKGKYYQSTLTSMTALGNESTADVYKMTGAGTIPAGKTVVLSGVTISGDQIACSGDATIILMGSNTVTAAANTAAIKIGGSSTTLTITGSGSLTVKGGQYAAAIGTGYANNASVAGGNIEINGGTVNATGGQSSAAIGTGYAYQNGSSNECGAITINGGTVTAYGGYAGIGTGGANQSSSNECGAITINGGTVTATGGQRSAAIGTGYANNSGSNKCGTITISTGVTSVTATLGNRSPNSIGKGFAANNGTQTCGTITIGGDATTYAVGVTESPFYYPTAP